MLRGSGFGKVQTILAFLEDYEKECFNFKGEKHCIGKKADI